MKIYFELFFLGFLTFLLFPPYFFLPLGFIVFPYLFKRINTFNIITSYKKNFYYGLSYGLGLNFFLFYWLKNPFFVEEQTKNLFFLSYIFIFYVSIYSGILFVLMKFFKNHSIRVIIFPAIFVLLEILKTKLFIAFPWNLLGYVIVNYSELFQISKFLGVYGTSYIVLLIFLLPIFLIDIIIKQNYKLNIIYLILILVVILFLSILSINETKISNQVKTTKLDILLHQSNIQQNERWKLENMEIRLNDLTNFISQNSNNEELTLLIFSETEIPYIISKDKTILNYIQSILDENTIVIIGAIRKNKEKNQYYNSMFRIDANSIEYFDKKILVPFGEYTPLKNIFSFIGKLSFVNSDFEKGTNSRNLLLINDLYFTPSICYENIFFENLITNNNSENDLIINITNDAWFGKYQGPYQHYYHSIARAIESNKYLIRVSNNGISAIVNPNGKILKSTELNSKTILKHSLYLQDTKNFKFYNLKYIVFYFYLIFLITICCIYQHKKNAK